MAIVYMTEEGYKKMLEEITFLETVKRPEISRQIAEARDKGDLSENAEYDAAKEAQGLLEMKIAQLKDKVANARMIDDTKLNTHTVQILNKVKIKNTKNNAVMQYMLVSESEANLKEGKIAVSTPIGKGLLRRYCRNTSSVRNYDIRNYRYIDLKWNDTSGLMPGRCRSCYTDCPCVHIL